MKPRMTHAEFLTKANAVHADKYDYSAAVFSVVRDKATIVCPEHGAFTQAVRKHLEGSGCPKCAPIATASKNTKGVAEFIDHATRLHGGRYDYSRTVYINAVTEVEIVCHTHGVFRQLPYVHTRGAGCPKCGNVAASVKKTHAHETFEAKARQAHGDKYQYTGAYTGALNQIEITCPTHGVFTQLASNHVQGMGCPSCAHVTSKPELEIVGIVNSQGCKAVHRYRPSWMNGKELDVFVPEHNLAIEYCGAHVHNTTRTPFGNPKPKWYHYDKWKLCRDNGVTLLTIYDFEWMTSREKWEAVIRHKLQKADRRVYARKCQIVSVERKVAYQFCKDHHIESAGGAWTMAAVCKGLEYAGELVAVMVEDKGDIKRSCTKSGIAVIGGVSKLFKSFPAGTTMMTTNNTGSSGNYGTLLEKKTLRYWWVKLGTVPKAYTRRQCQKHLLEEKFGEPLNGRTERQYMESLGFVQCYDAGLSYWINTPPVLS